MKRNDEIYYETLEDTESAYYQMIDEHFKNIAVNFGGKEVVIPAMIKESVLKRCGYFRSFPQHLTGIKSYFEQMNIDIDNANKTEESLFLTPAACLHIYPMLEDENVENSVITTKARVYRYEAERHDGNVRLWDFSVREIVAVGTERFVLDTLAYLREQALAYCNELGIKAEIKNATDPFYPSKTNEKIKKIQKINNLKKELTTCINGIEVAIASFNIHGTHFSKTFNFDRSGQIITGCVGFGLERWIAALREHKNNNKENI